MNSGDKLLDAFLAANPTAADAYKRRMNALGTVLSAACVSQVDHADTLHATSQALHGHGCALVCRHRIHWFRLLGTHCQ